MEVLAFPNNDAYYRAQDRSERWKKQQKPNVTEEEVIEIAGWLNRNRTIDLDGRSHQTLGICHGAREGVEIEMFERRLFNSFVIGTDILKRKHPRVRRHDFRFASVKWKGKFDFLYSNSFDHTDRPHDTAKIWLNQLKPEGWAFVTWSPTHMTLLEGDCFSAGLHEYLYLFREHGVVEAMLLPKCGRLVVVLVARRKREGE